MIRPSLHDRILAALRLQPMTVSELSRCLSVKPSTVRCKLREIDVHRVGLVRTHGRPWIRYAEGAA